MTKGQISIAWVIGIGVSIALAAFGTITATNNRTDDKVGAAQKETTLVSERVARLETSVPIMQADIKEIKDSLKGIERALRITK